MRSGLQRAADSSTQRCTCGLTEAGIAERPSSGDALRTWFSEVSSRTVIRVPIDDTLRGIHWRSWRQLAKRITRRAFYPFSEDVNHPHREASFRFLANFTVDPVELLTYQW